MKQWMKTAGMLALMSASAMAQVQTTGGTYNPVNTMWWIFFMVKAIFAAVMGIAILWHCMHGALGSHDGIATIMRVIIFGAIGFGVVYIIQNMVTGVATPVQV